ncbi:MAG: elongation factor 4 [Candidatus Harrisonbacteria bacterium CG10_big_fil_rev_8_21_14_0_10_40_38]|uniref:Elongation factor 4 n=1 Tax=Candidatus Harrisonbacteria bacterium CG10_big_fil_rev_8_21_14_0_10_40_38 TaxID=1974583 RepID=A0A2H0UUP9_9BACT|nr:MAG: elongation factor 4 [Candidatus Harrisonbacteria bacterium CG10_big_fil_rev_8_21_14_0_10_40_38]
MNQNIRNFLITAHVDHGKSTLADRMLEITRTIEMRSMKPQYLDQLDLERERGITIKMTPVRMAWQDTSKNDYILNLIDTPGHSDFKYEVSRALMAVEGAVLLVDATQGVQAQTLSNLDGARKANLTVLGVVNKIDVASESQVEDAVSEVSELLGIPPDEVFKVSGKSGEGVPELLSTIVSRVPPPKKLEVESCSRALIFDSLYDEHKGVIAFVRVFDGQFLPNARMTLCATGADFLAKDIGYFAPSFRSSLSLQNGEVGYIATGIKDPGKVRIGDTIMISNSSKSGCVPLPGYDEPKPVVFVSFYPEESDDYDKLRQAFGYLKLNDASLNFEPDTSEVLGRGFKVGFLGQLHFEITADRLAREFNVPTVHSFPSVAYKVMRAGEWITVTNPKDFPRDANEALELFTQVEILTPPRFLGALLSLQDFFRFSQVEIGTTGIKTRITAKLPLADLVSDLDDKIKSLSEGFASLSYEPGDWEKASVDVLEILVAGSPVPGLTRILPKELLEREGRATVEKLRNLLPRAQFTQALQARVGSKIIARETIPALRKDVTGYLYGGDRTRKMKLWKKQQAGKKKLKEFAEKQTVKIPASVFKELIKR